ncbi:hypothetical protein ACFC25_10310 [Pseudarthrobacter sp. NPDC055928]|uniref:hypothetical protein n=1 Tax=Pseudarthrobacter sp. NPDC055928 TaxID=3345661 RepID=UPI0035E18375
MTKAEAEAVGDVVPGGRAVSPEEPDDLNLRSLTKDADAVLSSSDHAASKRPLFLVAKFIGGGPLLSCRFSAATFWLA